MTFRKLRSFIGLDLGFKTIEDYTEIDSKIIHIKIKG